MGGPVSIVLVGVGGMGSVYVRELLGRADEGIFRIVGAVDPAPNRCQQYKELRALGVPCFVSLEDFVRNRRADLAILSTPIHLHKAQTCLALAKGSHVLCEKPAAGTIQEVREMAEAERASGRWVAVGYQWSFSTAIQALKRDVQAGLLGRCLKMKCLYLWPRDEAYYRRNDWAGRLRHPEGGWVLDSPAQNAMAHDLHNMLYILGGETDGCAMPGEVEAELYRANAIESFDTVAARLRTAQGVEVLFLASHVPAAERGPVFVYEFERGRVRCESRRSGVWAELAGGTRKDYGVPDDEPMNKLWRAIDDARGGGGRPLCGLAAAAGQTLAVNGMHEACPEIHDFPAGLVKSEGEGATRRLAVEGLDEAFERSFEEGRLPSELGVPWAVKGERVDLRDYAAFPARWPR